MYEAPAHFTLTGKVNAKMPNGSERERERQRDVLNQRDSDQKYEVFASSRIVITPWHHKRDVVLQSSRLPRGIEVHFVVCKEMTSLGGKCERSKLQNIRAKVQQSPQLKIERVSKIC